MKSLIYQLIYSPTLNFFLRNINKWAAKILPLKIRLPVSGVLEIKLKDGTKILFKTNQTDYVSFCVFWDGLYNYEYIDVFEKIIANCKGFVDVGANAGLFSLIAAKVNCDVKVIAIDPSSASDYYLKENVKINNLEHRIISYKVALSDKNESLEFYEVKNPKYPYLEYNLGGASSLLIKPKEFRVNKVVSYSLDHFFEENKIKNFSVDFIKIDAEGVEPQIIKGMKKIIEKHKPIIVCEVLFDFIHADLEKEFMAYGYKFYYPLNGKLVGIASLKDQPREIHNSFFIPDDRLEVLSGLIT